MSSNSSNNDYLTYLLKLNTSINNYLTLILPSIGVPFNLISIFIFWRLRRNKSNMVYLGIFQSVVDIIVLLLLMFFFKSQFTIGFALLNYSNVLCKLVWFFRRYIYIASSWMLVLTTFDRFVFVLFSYQNRFKFMKSKLYLNLGMIGLLTFLALINIPNFFYYLDSNTCTSSEIIDATTDIVAIIFRTFLPFGFMIFFNALMIRKIFKNNANFKTTALSRRELKLTFAVMAFDIYFFAVNLPLTVFYVISDVNTYSGAMKNNPVFKAQFGQNGLANIITINIALCQQTFAFFMHLIFNKLFRSEVLYLITRITGNKNRVMSSRSGTI